MVWATIAVGLAACHDRLGVCPVDRLHVVAVDLDRVPAESAQTVASRRPGPTRSASAPVWPSRLTSMIAVRLSRLVVVTPGQRPPTSTLRPSRCRRTAPTTRYGSRSRRLPASATPTPMGRPWPSEPVATSTHGSTGVGWPSSRLPQRRGRSRTPASSIAPIAQQDRVVERRRVALGEDQVVVVGLVRLVDAIAEVLGDQYRHQLGGRHGRGRMAGARMAR